MLISLLAGALAGTAVSGVSFVLWRRRLRKQSDADRIIQRLREEVDALVTDLNGTTERNVALIENRIHALNQCLERAERAAGVLKRETEKRDLAMDVYTSLGRSRMPALQVDVEAPPAETPHRDDGSSSVMEETQEVHKAESSDTPKVLPLRDRVLALYRDGGEPEAIAADLNMSRGEIDLIISLHDRRR